MNHGEPLSGEWLAAWEHAMLIEEAKEQKQLILNTTQIPASINTHWLTSPFCFDYTVVVKDRQ